MEYTLEELLPIVEMLTEKYTSNESTSITYETARRLMEAAMYCIKRLESKDNAIFTNEKLEAFNAYKEGYNMVIAKVYQAKEVYEHIIVDFFDYGCRNLYDTIIKGMPEFFLRYDPLFHPQDQLLTLDYQTIATVNELSGIDAIYQYLRNIQLELEFLKAFPKEAIEQLLEQKVADYENLYFDNISYDVLLIGIGCMIANKPVLYLELVPEDMILIEQFFEGDTEENAGLKLQGYIKDFIRKGLKLDKDMERYFLKVAGEYGVRIINGMKHHSLANVFGLKDLNVCE